MGRFINMSSPVDQSNMWTPEIIATIIYRVVMIVVSIAFLWKQYQQRPVNLDGEKIF